MAIDISEEQLAMESADLLKILLKDRTTKKNIVWATHSYELLGKGFAPSDRITPSRVTGAYANLIQPRSEKSKYEQKDRTKIRAEVFTPTWLVEKQNGYVEAELEALDLTDYIQVRWLEITCGEAPYMVTRYDTVTGEEIPLSERAPYLDDELASFPYVNGGMFAEKNIEIPNFTNELKDLFLQHASSGFDWSDISPTIFGAVFESTLNPKTRRSGGMHDTSIENIHKVIDPLFLNDLKDELNEIRQFKHTKPMIRLLWKLMVWRMKLMEKDMVDRK